MQRIFHARYLLRQRYYAARERTRLVADDDPLRAARGVVFGVLAGAAVWILLIVAYVLR